MEPTNEQIAKRLCFLWEMRETNPGYYVKNGFALEKEMIYTIYGQNNIAMKRAHDYFYETNKKKLLKIINEGSNIKLDLRR